MMEVVSTEEFLVRAELDRLGLPVPPPATLSLLVQRLAKEYAAWYFEEIERRLSERVPEQSLFGRFRIWTEVTEIINDRRLYSAMTTRTPSDGAPQQQIVLVSKHK